jgi:hypothetical protein
MGNTVPTKLFRSIRALSRSVRIFPSDFSGKTGGVTEQLNSGFGFFMDSSQSWKLAILWT